MPTKIILLLVATIGLNGCCFMQLREVDHMTELQQSGDFKQLAKSDVDCDPGQCGCSKQHFLKGDACFILAGKTEKTSPDYGRYLQCAGDNLFTVLDDTEDWDEISIQGLSEDEKRHQIYSNALEATRLQTTLPDRQQALAIFDQRAREFKRNAPDQAAANYYFIQNQLYQLDLSQAGCTDWQQLQQQAAQVQSRFMTDARYQAPISGVKLAVDAYINANCE
ncbi:MAG: hypothetical protein CMK83_10030 [Pseudomonadales bacterium]|jgi:hypothetical protein|nr:hypothetical protein [Pseudomonadales bacterium]MCK5792901.1 hypothetical protein [Ketobacter sp.]TNC89421.1 MAG: hypothetical protein CSH49_07260 [Alcanivorax sp.]HAG92497.1 hypothetical protein [Gammaproteobacteria bacterium]MAQ24550.1 hypothetical protein [Pseudomonadales bacterium]|tara:strand:+ start:3009 stop:3674 length:666 start_codon:yes stop_codon:yes gene_type:complete